MRQWFERRRNALFSRGQSQPEAVDASTGNGEKSPVEKSPVLARGSVRRVVLHASALWLATRVAIVAFSYFADLFRDSGPASHALPFTLHDLVATWQRWDAIWFLQIARHGYFTPQATAFFPLYPLLIRGGALLSGGHWLTWGLVISNLGALGGFIGVALIAFRETLDESAAIFSVRMLAAYPPSFFLAAPYTEGVFLALAAFALLMARLEKWRWAAVCAFLAALTRPTGIILAAPLLWQYGSQHGWWRRERWRLALPKWASRAALTDAVVALGAVPAGIGAYMLYLWIAFGDPLLFLHAEERFWGHGSLLGSVTPPSATTTHSTVTAQYGQPTPFAFTFDQARSLVDLVAVVVFLLLTLAMIRRLPTMYVLYMAGLVLLSVSSPRPDRLGIFVSAARYFVAAIPAFVLLGRWAMRRPWLDLLLVSGGFLLQAVLADFFLSGGWLV